MATEAVMKIKESEDKASEIIRNAIESAKEIKKAAELKSAENKSLMLTEAQNEKEKLMHAAALQANIDCEPIIAQGKEDVITILNPDNKKFIKAIDVIKEKIMNINCNE